MAILAIVPLAGVSLFAYTEARDARLDAENQALGTAASVHEQWARAAAQLFEDRVASLAQSPATEAAFSAWQANGSQEARASMRALLEPLAAAVGPNATARTTDLAGVIISSTRGGEVGRSLSAPGVAGAADSVVKSYTLGSHAASFRSMAVAHTASGQAGFVVIEAPVLDVIRGLAPPSEVKGSAVLYVVIQTLEGQSLYFSRDLSPGAYFEGPSDAEGSALLTAQNLPAGSGDFLALDDRARPLLAHRIHMPELGWSIVVSLDQSTALIPVARQAGLLVGAVLVTSSAIFAVAFLSSRSIVRPLEELASTATAIATGDLARTARVHTTDEIGVLARRFNEMTGALVQANRQLEARVVERTEELQRSNQDLEQFAYVASHDLQEPLRMVASYMQLLERRYREKLDDEARLFIDYAVGGARRMQQLIDDLLAYSRVGRKGQPWTDFELSDAVDAAVKNLEVIIQEEGAIIEYADLGRVRGDRTQFTQLMQNLLSNAIKFRSQEAPIVRITSTPKGPMAEIAVQDNGIGISPEYQERIFVIFQRLHSREKYPGSGIGLSLCKKIVERHGGRIWVESEIGKGATFRFTVPLASMAAEGPSEGEEEPGLRGPTLVERGRDLI
jgi:signal transduction histidine kinase